MDVQHSLGELVGIRIGIPAILRGIDHRHCWGRSSLEVSSHLLGANERCFMVH